MNVKTMETGDFFFNSWRNFFFVGFKGDREDFDAVVNSSMIKKNDHI